MRRYISGLQILLSLFSTIQVVTTSRSDWRLYYGSADEVSIADPANPFNIGPPNPPAECLELFGRLSTACPKTLIPAAVEGEHLARQQEAMRGGAIYVPIQMLANWETVQYLGPGASRDAGNGALRTYALPRSWEHAMGTREYACSVTLMTILDPGEDNKDNATAWDLRQAIDSLTSACSQGQGDGWCTGGYQIYGENNRLAAFAYHPDSEFSDAIDISRGCVRRRWVKVYDMMVRLRVFHRYCDDTGEDDSKGWGAESGPSGTKEIQQYCSNGKLSLADVLYGLDRAKQWVVENCQGAIVGVGSVG